MGRTGFFPEIDFNSPLRTEHWVGIGARVSAGSYHILVRKHFDHALWSKLS